MAAASARELAGVDQQRVAGGMPLVVVDELEAVDVAHDEGHVLAVDRRAAEDVAQALLQDAAVAEPGERIAECELLELGDALGLGDRRRDVGRDQSKRREVVMVEDARLGLGRRDHRHPRRSRRC